MSALNWQTPESQTASRTHEYRYFVWEDPGTDDKSVEAALDFLELHFGLFPDVSNECRWSVSGTQLRSGTVIAARVNGATDSLGTQQVALIFPTFEEFTRFIQGYSTSEAIQP